MSNQENDILIKLFNKVVDIEEKMVTKTEFETSKTEILNHIDGFIKLHETLDTELISLRSKYDRLEGWIKLVAEKTGIKLPT